MMEKSARAFWVQRIRHKLMKAIVDEKSRNGNETQRHNDNPTVVAETGTTTLLLEPCFRICFHVQRRCCFCFHHHGDERSAISLGRRLVSMYCIACIALI
jgi:hypothetical protein